MMCSATARMLSKLTFFSARAMAVQHPPLQLPNYQNGNPKVTTAMNTPVLIGSSPTLFTRQRYGTTASGALVLYHHLVRRHKLSYFVAGSSQGIKRDRNSVEPRPKRFRASEATPTRTRRSLPRATIR